jgi:hypothetical protein
MKMNMPGFSAESSLGPGVCIYQRNAAFGSSSTEGGGQLVPQLGFGGDPDYGEYWRCRENGGPDLICRFFAGLPPYVLGRYFY